MNSHTIDAKSFQKLFLAGANRINSRKDYINELNVFPVPDGDTGTNMSLTILAAAKEVGACLLYTSDNRISKTGRNITNTCPFFLCLLYFGIHEHSTA